MLNKPIIFNIFLSRCALILMSEEAVKRHNVKPLARIVSYADAEVGIKFI
jgi:acetyl-CoA acetyltransferase